MSLATYEDLVAMLNAPGDRWELTRRFIRGFNYELEGDDPEVNEVLQAVMTLLADYEPRPEFRHENDPHYGDEKIEEIVQRYLAELDRLGIGGAREWRRYFWQAVCPPMKERMRWRHPKS